MCIRDSTRRTASGPRSSYLKSGLTSMSAAASRIALYSITCESWYAPAAKKPDQVRHWRCALRGWKAVPTVTWCAPPLDTGAQPDRLAVTRIVHEAYAGWIPRSRGRVRLASGRRLGLVREHGHAHPDEVIRVAGHA